MRRLVLLSLLAVAVANSASFVSQTALLPGSSSRLMWSTAAWAPVPQSLADIVGNTGADHSLLAISGAVDSTTFRTFIIRFEGGIMVSVDSTSIPGVINGSLDWADWDLDGYLDLAVIGRTDSAPSLEGDRITAVFNGTALGTWEKSTRFFFNFTDDDNPNNDELFEDNSTTWVDSGAVQWGDFDSDGDADLLITGLWSEKNVTNGITTERRDAKVYLVENVDPLGASRRLIRNNQSMTGVHALTAVFKSAVAWADYDRDGDFDLAVSGQSRADLGLGLKLRRAETMIFENTPNFQISRPSGTLVAKEDEFVSTGAERLLGGGLSWGDLDNDGLLDLAMSGYTDTSKTNLRLYVLKSRLGGGFERAAIGVDFTNASAGPLEWGDLDNDGYQDLVMVGLNSVGVPATRIMKNQGDETLAAMTITDDPLEPLRNLAGGTVKLGDLNNDGTLDIFLCGQDEVGDWYSQLLRINPDGPNTPPSIPDIPKGEVTGREVRLSWIGSTDGERPKATIGYEFVAFDANSSDRPIFSTRATFNQSRASRLIGRDVQRSLPVSPSGFSWYVRAVDASGAVSAWSNQDKMVVGAFVISSQNLVDVHVGSSSGWADYDNDGDLDLLLVGIDPGLVNRAQLYENVDGIMRTVANADGAFAGVFAGNQAWGDFDGDGDLDVAITGQENSENKITHIYRNDGGGVFNRVYSGRPMSLSRLAWGDVDNDGDLDLVVTGFETEPSSGLLRIATFLHHNMGGDVPFRDGVYPDGSFEDLNLRGSTTATNPFMETDGVISGWISLFDFDLDGDLDLTLNGSICDTVVSGSCEPDKRLGLTEIYSNDGNGNFSRAFGSELLLQGYIGQHRWGDLNGDGYPDLVVVAWQDSVTVPGTTGFFGYVMAYLGQAGGAGFTPVEITANGLYGSAMELVDLNNDGDLDILNSGEAFDGISGGFASIRQLANDGTGSYILDVGTRVLTDTKAVLGSLAAADFDGDRDVDFIVTGTEKLSDGQEVPLTQLFESTNAQLGNINLMPDSPLGLVASVDTTSTVALSWEKASDVGNNSPVTYSLRVGSEPDIQDILSGAKPAGFGGMGYTTSVPLNSLNDGHYFWSVRSVDHAFMASDWAIEDSFTVDTTPPVIAGLTDDTLRIGTAQILTVDVVFDDGIVGTGMNALSPGMEVSIIAPTGVSIVVTDTTWDATGTVMTGRLQVPADFDTGLVNLRIHFARDRRGNTMPDTTLETQIVIDTQSPSVDFARTVPRAGQVGVTTTVTPHIFFSEPMDNKTLTDAGVRVEVVATGATLAGDWSPELNRQEGSLNLSTRLEPETNYRLIIPGSLVDRALNPLGDDVTLLFRTATRIAASSGGTVINADSTVSLYIPPNPKGEDAEIFFNDPDLASLPALPAGGAITSLVYELGSDIPGLNFQEATAVLTIRYDEGVAKVASVQAEEDLRIFRVNTDVSPAVWEFVGGTVNTVENTVVAPIEFLGTYALFVGGNAGTLVASLSDLDCQPRVFKAKGSSSLRDVTSITFTLQNASPVTIRVYNRTGRLVRIVEDNRQLTEGLKTLEWDGKDEDGKPVASGNYAVSVTADSKHEVKVVVVVNK